MQPESDLTFIFHCSYSLVQVSCKTSFSMSLSLLNLRLTAEWLRRTHLGRSKLGNKNGFVCRELELDRISAKHQNATQVPLPAGTAQTLITCDQFSCSGLYMGTWVIYKEMTEASPLCHPGTTVHFTRSPK